MARSRKLVIDRFWNKVAIGDPDDCWLWTAGLTGSGYGAFCWRLDERVVYFPSHRLAYELVKGPIPDGLHLDHLCRVPACVNPDHLEAVTVRENTLRGVGPSARAAVATHCIHGHPFTPDNTWVDPKRNTRHCRECNRRRWHEWNARRAHQAEAELAKQGAAQ